MEVRKRAVKRFIMEFVNIQTHRYREREEEEI
jgi:hypothetical protein